MSAIRPSTGPPQFLLVEDDDLVAITYRRVLQRYGLVVLAGSVIDACLALADLNVTGLITDITLPDGSGFEIARTARARAPELPILILSGDVDPYRLDAADELRAAYLMKPVRPSQLARFAERAITRQHRTAALIDEWVVRYSLSAAESITWRLSLDGRKREEIAALRGVSPHTVRVQVGSMLAKLGAPTVAKAVAAFFAELSRLQ